MITYTVERQLSGSFWVLNIPEVPGAFTQARLGHWECELMARDCISLMLEVPADSFDIEIRDVLA